MSIIKQVLANAAIATFMGTAALLVTAPAASAYVACNRDGGDCWHTDKRVHAPDAHLDYHPDDWYFHQKWDGNDHHFRDYHEGRGYYKGGVWIDL